MSSYENSHDHKVYLLFKLYSNVKHLRQTPIRSLSYTMTSRGYVLFLRGGSNLIHDLKDQTHVQSPPSYRHRIMNI